MVLLSVASGCAGTGQPPTAAPSGQPSGLSALDRSTADITAVRGRLLAKVDAVQRAATALDDADQACARGEGSPARTAHRAARPLLGPARIAVASLGGDVAAYTDALRVLGLVQGKLHLEATQTAALAQVVRDGLSEAAALSSFRAATRELWPVYEQLDGVEDTWITRAVTPWYRNAQEGSSAYALLVAPTRPALDRARASLGAAVEGLMGPSRDQSATLAAANRALESLRQG